MLRKFPLSRATTETSWENSLLITTSSYTTFNMHLHSPFVYSQITLSMTGGVMLTITPLELTHSTLAPQLQRQCSWLVAKL